MKLSNQQMRIILASQERQALWSRQRWVCLILDGILMLAMAFGVYAAVGSVWPEGQSPLPIVYLLVAVMGTLAWSAGRTLWLWRGDPQAQLILDLVGEMSKRGEISLPDRNESRTLVLHRLVIGGVSLLTVCIVLWLATKAYTATAQIVSVVPGMRLCGMDARMFAFLAALLPVVAVGIIAVLQWRFVAGVLKHQKDEFIEPAPEEHTNVPNSSNPPAASV